MRRPKYCNATVRKDEPSAPAGPKPLQNPTTTERLQYTAEELDFLRAIDTYKRLSRRPYPTWREVLAVLISRGWRRVAQPSGLPTFRLTQRQLKESGS
jgi:hypothetical protein